MTAATSRDHACICSKRLTCLINTESVSLNKQSRRKYHGSHGNRFTIILTDFCSSEKGCVTET